jgi:hypothetical protein
MPRAITTARRGRVTGRGDLATSLLLVFPLFLAYELGVIFANTMNGVDFVTRTVFDLVGRDLDTYIMVHLGVAVAYLGYLVYLRRRRGFSLALFTPMLLESAIYALTLGSFIVFVMQNLFGFDGVLSIADSLSLGPTGQKVVISLGAGVHEELVFRLGLMAGGAWVLRRLGLQHTAAVVVALALSSLAFSAAHHIGPYGEPFRIPVFTYRALAGVVFGLIFYFRSLSHAVYTHFLYDLYVLLIRS